MPRYFILFHLSLASMKLPIMLLCKGTCASVVPPFKRYGGNAPVMYPRSGVPVYTPADV